MTNKNRIGIVIGREFNTRVRKRSFIVVTLLVPILMIAFISLPIILGMYSVGKEKIAVVDRTGNHYADILPITVTTALWLPKTIRRSYARWVRKTKRALRAYWLLTRI